MDGCDGRMAGCCGGWLGGRMNGALFLSVAAALRSADIYVFFFNAGPAYRGRRSGITCSCMRDKREAVDLAAQMAR